MLSNSSATPRTNLNSIGSLTDDSDVALNLYVNSTQEYISLGKEINHVAKQFKSRPLESGFVIKCYDAQTGGNDITNNKQTTGNVWVEIDAVDNDLNWEGKTSQRLQITLLKMNLSGIESLRKIKCNCSKDLEFAASTNPYSNLNNKLVDVYEIDGKKLVSGFDIKYYDLQTGGTDITSNTQADGDVWIEISASDNDPNWEGQTERIKITLKSLKTNLNTITRITMNSIAFSISLYINVNSSLKNSEATSTVAAASEFKYNKLKTGYEVKYYDAQTGGNDITNSDQIVGDIWVKIKAASDDEYWEGETERIKIKFIKSSLSDISELKNDSSGKLVFKANSGETFEQLNAKIMELQKIFSIPLANNTQFAYKIWTGIFNVIGKYSNVNKTELQKKGTFFVNITADSADPNWKGSTKDFEFTLE